MTQNKEKLFNWIVEYALKDSTYQVKYNIKYAKAIRTIRKALEQPKPIDIEGVKIPFDITHTEGQRVKREQHNKTISLLKEKGYLRTPLPHIEGLESAIFNQEDDIAFIESERCIILEAAQAYAELMEKNN